MARCVHCDRVTARPLRAKIDLPDDGVGETSAVEVQPVALGPQLPVEA